jgi:clan AA aspartic protease
LGFFSEKIKTGRFSKAIPMVSTLYTVRGGTVRTCPGSPALPDQPRHGIFIEGVSGMGTVCETITLKNALDVGMAGHGLIKESEVRETTVQSTVDTGAMTLVINEEVQQALGLMTKHLRDATLANGEKVVCKVAEAVEVIWKDRSMTCEPWVVPGAKEVLLGVIPLEDMDLMVNPVNQKLVGVHGDKPVGMLY